MRTAPSSRKQWIDQVNKKVGARSAAFRTIVELGMPLDERDFADTSQKLRNLFVRSELAYALKLGGKSVFAFGHTPQGASTYWRLYDDQGNVLRPVRQPD